MPIKLIRVNEDLPLEEIQTGPGLFTKIIPTLSSAIESFRTSAVWRLIMDRDYMEAAEKLNKMVREDLGVTEFELQKYVPCIVDIKEGKTLKEQARIERAHKQMSKSFAKLVDRLVRYRPESRQYAFDSLKQEMMDTKPLWKPFECNEFRTFNEVNEKNKKGKNKRQLKKIS